MVYYCYFGLEVKKNKRMKNEDVHNYSNWWLTRIPNRYGNFRTCCFYNDLPTNPSSWTNVLLWFFNIITWSRSSILRMRKSDTWILLNKIWLEDNGYYVMIIMTTSSHLLVQGKHWFPFVARKLVRYKIFRKKFSFCVFL